jgi:predicted Ser/Thr protein kinase
LSTPYHNKALSAGTVLREWRLEEVLGAGGFGIVYRGRSVYFDETVAIKEYFPGAISDRVDGTTVAPTDSSSEEVYELGRKKFLEEAKILWNLSRPERHPNIVNVRSLFEIHGTAYMVMDFENGVSLSQMLKEGRHFDEKSLLAMIRPIAEGLDRAHRAGVLHRDIKPANILVDEKGRSVLIDFGSARFESGQATNTKVTFYTPPYAAIEQYVKTYPQGPWTDIYALGVVLYQCVAGEKPPEVLERLHGGLGRPLSSRQWPGFSPAFTRAVDAAMGIRPQERPQSISEWLKLFDGGDGFAQDEPTRIAVMAREAPAPPAIKTAEPVTRPAPPAAAAATSQGPGRKTIIIGALAAMLIGTVGALALWMHLPAQFPAQSAAKAPVQAAASGAQANLSQSLASGMDGLIAAAGKANRPRDEINGLNLFKTNILAEAGKSGAGAASVNDMARDMAKKENAALARSAKRLAKDMEEAPASDDPNAAKAVAALQTAKSDMDARLAIDFTDLDAVSAMEAARQALVSFALLQSAYDTARPVYVSARQKQFAALYSSVQAQSEQVVALANVSKPWFLASTARKQAFQLRQDNAAQAKAVMAPLTALSGNTADLAQLTAAIAQVSAAQKTLSDLYTASNAANPG